MKKVILKRHFFAEKFGGFKKKHYLCTRFRDNQSTGEMVQSEHWRDGRVVDYSSLENYRTERYRGFESLSLRSNKLKPADFQRVLFFSSLEVPFEVPFFFYESLT